MEKYKNEKKGKSLYNTCTRRKIDQKKSEIEEKGEGAKGEKGRRLLCDVRTEKDDEDI